MTDHIGEATEKVIDLDPLEKLADEATPGPWFDSNGVVWFDSRQEVCCGRGYHQCCGKSEIIGGQEKLAESNPTDAAFIAAANPATIKALIAELKEARGLLEPFAREAESWPELADSDTLAMTAPDGTASAYDVTMKDIRAARAFLARNGKGEG